MGATKREMLIGFLDFIHLINATLLDIFVVS